MAVSAVSRRRSARLGWWVSAGVLVVIGVLMLAPFVFMISTSLNADARTAVPFPPQIIPHHVSFEAYRIAVQGINLGRLYLNTLLVEVVEIAFSLGSALLSGYALSKIKPRGTKVILLLSLSTMMIPSEMTIIPNFLTFERLHLLDTYWPIWLPAIAYPFGTFLVKQYLDALPGELREAARVEGAGELRILTLVYLPLCKGIVATLTILLFLSIWNNYLWPLIVINDPDRFTIQLGIASFNQSIGGQSYALPAINMATTLLSIIPVLAVYLFFQRYIVESVASSAVKG
jgi:multiple sugar transport system permease protein